VRTSELVAAAYAAYIAIVAARPKWPGRQRAIAWIGSGAILLSVVWLATARQTPWIALARDWAPALYILVGYYAAGALFVGPSPAFEGWLGRCDRRVLGVWRPERLSAGLRAAFETCYAGTFLMIPAGFAVLVAGGRRADADRYWTIVALAELVAFGVLPWLPSRPPWIVEVGDGSEPSAIRRLALGWVRRTSHCANTFPSGHTAGSLAIALAVATVMPAAGLVLLAIALGIAIGCVTGRYHYVIDVLAGAVLALLAWAVVDWGLSGHSLR
jgi:membrane-associated phospholipid phosphatase